MGPPSVERVTWEGGGSTFWQQSRLLRAPNSCSLPDSSIFVFSAATWVSDNLFLSIFLAFSFSISASDSFYILLLILLLSASDSSSDSFTFCFWVFFWWFFFAFWFWFFFWFFLYSAFDPCHLVNHHLQAPIIITVDSFIHSNRNIHMGEILFSGWLPLRVPTS